MAIHCDRTRFLSLICDQKSFLNQTMKPYTAKERHHLNETLSKPLGPEYLSYRSGSFGRLTYITGGIAVQLANEIFGFDGWSSEIKNTTIDYVNLIKLHVNCLFFLLKYIE
jgi:recombination DNA repair RAD52 pathway protein